jgi:Lrp/AsnC family transcriptional regulator for asnA, asnC and gidA
MIDETDKKLIKLLQEDGRRTNQALARQLKISRATALRRIRKLIEGQIIRITAFVDPSRVGSPTGVLFALEVTRHNVESVMEVLAEQPMIGIPIKTAGRFNILALAIFNSIDELSQFVRDVLAKMDGIRNSETLLLLHIEQESNTPHKTINIDYFDKQLFRLINADGRQSTVALSKQLNVSPTTVQRRLQKLLKSGTIRIAAIVDISKVDWFISAAILVRVELKSLVSILNKLSRYPMVQFVSCTTGRFDIMVSTRSESLTELYEFVEAELASMNGVKDYELLIAQELKYGNIYLSSIRD